MVCWTKEKTHAGWHHLWGCHTLFGSIFQLNGDVLSDFLFWNFFGGGCRLTRADCAHAFMAWSRVLREGVSKVE